jgi:hypothetical protein
MAELDVGEIPAPLYLMARAAAFAPQERRDDSGMIRRFEPTRPLRDSVQTTYIARISAADPTHRPAMLAEVEPQVKADVITAQAYELAKADANKLLDAARQKGLSQATSGKGVVSIGPLSNRPDQPIAALGLQPGLPANQFVGACFDLLGTPTSRPSGSPVALIELPREGKVIVTELGKVDATWTQRTLPFQEAQLHALLTEQMAEGFIRAWFNYQSIAARTNFVAEAGYKESESPAAPPPPAPPIF